MNYMKEKYDKIKYECVERCLENIFWYKEVCFDICLFYLKYYLLNCMLNCLKVYLFILSDNVFCV